MRIGFLGAGKLGGPVALAMESKGHDVLVCDKADWVRDAFDDGKWPHKERGVPELMETTKISCVPLGELVRHSEIIFVAVQTPHEHQYGGAVPLPPDRKDFDYTALKRAVVELVNTVHNPTMLSFMPVEKMPLPFVTAVISTVLPGTMRREILPLLPKDSPFVYCPFFAAMGTVVEDVLDPEFVLLGVNHEDKQINTPEEISTIARMAWFFGSLHDAPFLPMSVESAELAKVAYNTFIEMKVTWANTVMEIAHKVPGCHCDEVSEALKQATDRLVSPRYMEGGVVGGGACVVAGTKISLLDGREVPIEELVGLDEFFVYSYDLETKRIVPGRATDCRLTRKRTETVSVVLDNGQSIHCTPDHEFLLRDGTYREAGALVSGDSLMPLYRSKTQGGYEILRHPGVGREVTHKVVFRWKYGYDSSFQTKCAHHEDHNKRNNHPDSIGAVTAGEHSTHHNNQPGRREKQAAVLRKLCEDGVVNTPEQREHTRQRNLTNNPVWRPGAKEKMSEANRVTQRKKVEDGTHHLVTNNPTPRRIEEGVHNFIADHPMKDEAKKAQMIATLNETNAKENGFSSHEESVRTIRRMRHEEGRTVDEIMSILGVSRRFVYYRLDRSLVKSRPRKNNHKVVSVVPVGLADVYNFEVEATPNYAVTAGVFIHNCHPRDNIAMSWLAQQKNISGNFFESVMQAREAQATWLVDLFQREAGDLPLVLLGKAYKPESELIDGSAGLLMAKLLEARNAEFSHYDPYVDKGSLEWMSYQRGMGLGTGPTPPMAFLICTRHECFATYDFPAGSVVVDPFRMVPEREGVRVVAVGRDQ